MTFESLQVNICLTKGPQLRFNALYKGGDSNYKRLPLNVLTSLGNTSDIIKELKPFSLTKNQSQRYKYAIHFATERFCSFIVRGQSTL